MLLFHVWLYTNSTLITIISIFLQNTGSYGQDAFFYISPPQWSITPVQATGYQVYGQPVTTQGSFETLPVSTTQPPSDPLLTVNFV